MKLKYQTVIYPDGTVALHETIIDAEGNVTSASYEAIRLEAPSAGELEQLLRQVYHTLTKTKPITSDELDEQLIKADSFIVEDDFDADDVSNVVSLVDFMSR